MLFWKMKPWLQMGLISLEIKWHDRYDWLRWFCSPFSVWIPPSTAIFFYFLFNNLKILELHSFFVQTAQILQDCTCYVELHVKKPWTAVLCFARYNRITHFDHINWVIGNWLMIGDMIWNLLQFKMRMRTIGCNCMRARFISGATILGWWGRSRVFSKQLDVRGCIQDSSDRRAWGLSPKML